MLLRLQYILSDDLLALIVKDCAVRFKLKEQVEQVNQQQDDSNATR